MSDRKVSREQVQQFLDELNALQDRHGLVAMSSDDCCGGYRVDVIGDNDYRPAWAEEFQTDIDHDTGHWCLKAAVTA